MTNALRPLFNQIPHCLYRDQFHLKRRLQQLAKRQNAKQEADKELEKLRQAIIESAAKRLWRQNNLPTPEFPEDLPVSEHRDDIIKALLENQVIIVAGETGSGKTTQLPKICLQAGRGVSGLIGCTQPRRIAARSIANRIASELKSDVGHTVGYQVRFHDKISENSYIKLMTDGILLAEIQRDRFLNAYDTLIIDEAHERSLNIDFLLGYLKQLLPRRPQLKLIVTSATIDTTRFSKHFNNAPVIEVAGRSYPVEVRYRPPHTQVEEGDKSSSKTQRKAEIDRLQAILDATDEVARSPFNGDMLIFLSGERDIRETAEALRKHHPPNTEILPLYARLSSSEQDRVFKPGKQRRIVLATNVAETSLTVPRIHAVIDPGLARISRYSVRSKVQRLQIEPVSQASANQRKGRCGRIAAGLCIRLYTEEDFEQREAFTPPELLRTSLAAVILKMLELRLGEVEDFPFLEAPEGRAINDGFRQLEELGAVNKQRQLTHIGKQLARLPIDPRLGRMLIAAKDTLCLPEMLIITSALSVQDPRERPLEAQQAADEAQAQFADEKSDFLSYLKLWDFYQTQSRHLSQNKLRKLCRKHFLSWLRMREWIDIYRQLHTLLADMGWLQKHDKASAKASAEEEREIPYQPLHQALLSGLLSHIGFQHEQEQFLGARGIKLAIFPGSGLFKKKPKWMVAAELVETSKLYGRCVAKIEPEWIEQVAGALCRHNYFEPHWEKRRAQVAAFERVTLYGLTLVAKRKVSYGKIDPQTSREIFIREALVNQHFHTRQVFFKHNQQLIADIENLEHKARRQDILVDEQRLYEFYDKHIPEHIYSGPAFEKWYKKNVTQKKHLLHLEKADLMQRSGSEITDDQFPAEMTLQGSTLKLSYHFEPGHAQDGVTVEIPVSLLAQLRPEPFDWLVQGLRKEKIIALMRGLPKQWRKNFVPIPDFAQAAFEALEPCAQSITRTLGSYLQRISGAALPDDLWQAENLPEHLKMNYTVLDGEGKKLGTGRDLKQLQQQWKTLSHQKFTELPKQQWEREQIRDWDFGELPESVALQSKGVPLQGWPALTLDKDKKQGDNLCLRLFDDPETAETQHRRGLRYLFLQKLAANPNKLRKQIHLAKNTCLQYSSIGICEQLKDDILYSVLDHITLQQPLPRKRSEFLERLQTAKDTLYREMAETSKQVSLILETWHQVFQTLHKTDQLFSLPVLSDIRQHLNHLVYPGFIQNTPATQLRHLPRYLKAVQKRLERLSQSPTRDASKEAELAPLWQRYWQCWEQQQTQLSPELKKFRWELEELRVSLFAQELRTVHPVSVARLEKRWKQINATLSH